MTWFIHGLEHHQLNCWLPALRLNHPVCGQCWDLSCRSGYGPADCILIQILWTWAGRELQRAKWQVRTLSLHRWNGCTNVTGVTWQGDSRNIVWQGIQDGSEARHVVRCVDSATDNIATDNMRGGVGNSWNEDATVIPGLTKLDII